MGTPLSVELLQKIDAYWRAANYLAVDQIYLYDNPLLRLPLRGEHVKPRLLGHWAIRTCTCAPTRKKGRSPHRSTCRS
jgi:phosphoketolase